MHLEISDGTKHTQTQFRQLGWAHSVCGMDKTKVHFHMVSSPWNSWITTLESSFACIFLTRFIWNPCTLWDSYLLESSSWWHVLIRARKLREELCLFSSLKRKNEGGKGSALNPSLEGQRWLSRNPLEGTKQHLWLCPCEKHIEECSHGKVRFQWHPTVSRAVLVNTGGAKMPVKVCSSEDTVKATPTMQLVFCPQWQHLSSLFPVEQCYYLLPNSKPAIFPIQLQTRTCGWSQLLMDTAVARLLYPLALLVHGLAVFCYLGRKDISALPLCKSRMEASRALIYCCCSPDWPSFISGWFLHRIWAVMAKDLMALFLFHSISQASWTNTSEQRRWDTILMLGIKIYLCTDYEGKKLLLYNGNCWFNGCRNAGCRGQKLLYSKGNYALKRFIAAPSIDQVSLLHSLSI